MTFDILSDPKKARLISLLYDGYQMPRDELLKEMGVSHKELESLLKATEVLWETSRSGAYRLTERGNVAYGIMKSRNIEIKRVVKAENRKKKSFLGSIREEFSKRFL